tara:strand:- start:1615 stop:2232 length:618 start_codon:yes stop_codon:yes gene_type:complete
MCIIQAGMLGLQAAGAAAANSALIGLTTAAFSQVGQRQQAQAYNRMMAQRQQVGTELALENFANQARQASARERQEEEAAADEIGKVASEGRKAAALASLSAAERGVTGQGIDQIFNDFEAQELRYQTQVRRSLSFRQQAIRDNLEQARRGAQANIMNLQFMPRTGPNLLAGALQIAGQAYGTYNQFRFQGPSPRTTAPNVGDNP